jgi:dihydrofolate synthase / folylpolyglutamate synthase
LTFTEACAFLFPRLGEGKEWTLEPTRRLLASLGDPHRLFPIVHVGGTNGKGSVVVMVASALAASGARVGLYTSPHLVNVRERIAVNGRPITPSAFTAWTSRLQAEILSADASFFEVLTVMALADFAARGVDIAVVEVGLGGRLDSTNVVEPAVATVTNVSLEHMDYLGNTLESIAREKAGIAKRGVPFVIGEADEPSQTILTEVARGRRADVRVVPRDATYPDELGLGGLHQRRNAAIAHATLTALPDALRPTSAQMARGFAAAWLPGRFERRGRWILDVAHNPAGTRTLVAALVREAPPRPLHALFAALRDKDAVAMLTVLATVVDRIIVTVAPSAPPHRRVLPSELTYPPHLPIDLVPDFDRALSDVQAGAATMLVTGSFHTVGDAMMRLPGFRPVE